MAGLSDSDFERLLVDLHGQLSAPRQPALPPWVGEGNDPAQVARESASMRMMRSVRQPSSLMARTQAQYPVLQQYDIPYTSSIGRSPNYLESWAAGETGSPSFQRPAQLPLDKFGVENYRADTKPIDVLGDVVSHQLINTDPKVKQVYSDFTASLEPWQKDRLRKQYAHAQASFGEKRPFDAWAESSGVPAYFRGRPFQQWPDSDDMYTPKQREMLDGMMRYLSGR